ncbi:unnamed protein product [Cylicocyclus nassatus]|uniref:SCP domain-containing protein n=1 Tax=Cylicocyclus nassatus TaxID=53992 RepID=A0AA36GF92_CYLNA|nr:unnamed protein product [Cylicocyclus nassatus]
MFATSQQAQCDNHDEYLIDSTGRDIILEIHNQKRQSTASAGYRNGVNTFNIRYAKNMLEMKYDYFTQFFANKKPTVYHWSQMVWAKTYKIGCEIGDCDGKTIVMCRYSPKGNVVGEKVYQPGKVLTCENEESQ